MRSIAVFSVKGGVGKSAIAVNLAYASASLSGRRTLLWDLDAQGAASFTMRLGAAGSARKAFADGQLGPLIRPSDFAGLDVLAADSSLRDLEVELLSMKAKRLKKLLKSLEQDYDRIILDCPPGLTELADQVFRAVDLLVVPIVPAPLSERAFVQLTEHLKCQHKNHPAVLPVFSMADRRKTLHRQSLMEHPERTVIPYAAAVESMASTQLPLLATPKASPAARGITTLWTQIERCLAKPAI